MSQTIRDYSRQDLRGRSFKGQDLTGANFSHADIRGANLSNTVLREANFTGVRAGLKKNWIFGVVLLIVLLSVALSSESIFISIAVTVGIVTSLSLLIAQCESKLAIIWNVSLTLTIITPIALCVALINSLVRTGIFSVSVVKAGLVPFTLALTGLLYSALRSSKARTITSAADVTKFGSLPFSIALLYEFWKAMLAVNMGTSFWRADLTGANFTEACIKHTNFSQAKLISICWLQAKNIELAFFRNTYLTNPHVQRLVMTGQGREQNFDGLNLEGINLQGASLQGASFVGSNLNYANLRDTNLSRAVLKQTQLDGADLAGAILTGAYIEDWGITADTNLDGIKCEYIYMRVPTPDDPDPIRKPDNRKEIFEDDDFADFIKPLTDTLDLYHNQGVDPRAIAIAFKDLAENHPEAELEIVAMEKRGRDKFLLRARTAKTADKSALSTEYFSTYNRIKGLPEVEIKALLGEKDRRIQSLEAMVVTALQRPSFYSHVERADMVSNNPGGISQSVSGGNVYGGMQAAQGSGNVQSQEIHSIASSEQGLTQDQVIQLFAQLESALRQPELPAEAQAKAVKYLDAAKEEVQAKEPDKQLAAGNLKRMAETVESTSKTMESGKKIWETTKPVLEALLPWLGVAKSFFGF